MFYFADFPEVTLKQSNNIIITRLRELSPNLIPVPLLLGLPLPTIQTILGGPCK